MALGHQLVHPPPIVARTSAVIAAGRSGATTLRRRSDFAKRILPEKAAPLLLKSQVVRDYPGLSEYLVAHPKLTDVDVTRLDREQRVFYQDTFPLVLQQAIREWKPDLNHFCVDLSPASNHCSLCDTKYRYECLIVNTLNGTEMNVGRECVKHFHLHESLGMNWGQAFRESRRIQRYNQLSQQFPHIRQIIDEWPHDLDGQPIIVPDRLERPYLDLWEKARHIVEAFVAGKPPEGYEEDLRRLLDEKDAILAEINRWVAENKEDPLAATRKIETWLRSRPAGQAALNLLKRTGFISQLSLPAIDEPEFMKKLVPVFDEILRPSGVSVEKAVFSDSGIGGYVLVYQLHPKARLFCSHQRLAQEYGGPIFGKMVTSLLRPEYIVAICQIHDSQARAEIMTLLTKALKSGVTIHDFDVEADKVTLFEQRTGKYLTASLCQMAERFKALAFGLRGQSVEDVTRWVGELTNARMSKDDMREVGVASATMHRNRKWGRQEPNRPSPQKAG